MNRDITSRDVAEWFGKRHDAVLRDLRHLVCSELFREKNYVKVPIRTSTGRRSYYVRMTVKGFLFLILGYSGEKYAQRKEFYLDQFVNESESENFVE